MHLYWDLVIKPMNVWIMKKHRNIPSNNCNLRHNLQLHGNLVTIYFIWNEYDKLAKSHVTQLIFLYFLSPIWEELGFKSKILSPKIIELSKKKKIEYNNLIFEFHSINVRARVRKIISSLNHLAFKWRPCDKTMKFYLQ